MFVCVTVCVNVNVWFEFVLSDRFQRFRVFEFRCSLFIVGGELFSSSFKKGACVLVSVLYVCMSVISD